MIIDINNDDKIVGKGSIEVAERIHNAKLTWLRVSERGDAVSLTLNRRELTTLIRALVAEHVRIAEVSSGGGSSMPTEMKEAGISLEDATDSDSWELELA